MANDVFLSETGSAFGKSGGKPSPRIPTRGLFESSLVSDRPMANFSLSYPWKVLRSPSLFKGLLSLQSPSSAHDKKNKNHGGFIDRQRKRVVAGEEENRGARFSPCAHASALADVSKRMKRKIKPCLCTGRERPKPMEWNRLNFPLQFKPFAACRKLKY